jgi:post-segregation antitoxin (ccd killing protein)
MPRLSAGRVQQFFFFFQFLPVNASKEAHRPMENRIGKKQTEKWQDESQKPTIYINAIHENG